MPNFQCNVCHQQFTGVDALEVIKEHVIACAVTKTTAKEEFRLFQQLKEAFPIIGAIAYDNREDYDEPDYLLITRADGASYTIPYRFGSVYPHTVRKEDPFDVASNAIEAIEKMIDDVINGVKKQVPTSDIRFVGIRENTGWLGNQYQFELTVNEKTETVQHYKNNGTLDKFIGKILSFYQTDIQGVLTKFNDEYSVSGISINQWLLNHVGKEIELKAKK